MSRNTTLRQILRPLLWLFWVFMGLHIFTVGPWILLSFWAGGSPLMVWVAVFAVITLVSGVIEAIATLFSKTKDIQWPTPSVFFGCLGFAGIIELYAILYAYGTSWSLQTIFPIDPKIFTTIILVVQSCTSFILLMSFGRPGTRLLLISLLLWELILSYGMRILAFIVVNDAWP